MNRRRRGDYFAGKKIIMMGLGLLGRGVGVAEFLARHQAELIITDLKTRDRLASSIDRLKPHESRITYVLGEHQLEDFENRDMVIKAAGVPLDSPYIAHAREKGVPIEMDASLFARLAPNGVTIIGITGTRGKSTTTHLIEYILKTASKTVFLGGNVRGVATLPLLEKVKPGDYVVLELDSWQLQGFGEAKISPSVAVFTTFMPDHMNYYKNSLDAYFADKSNIFKFQKRGDVIVVGREVADRISKTAGRKVVVSAESLPKTWRLKLIGKHNRLNAALAREVGLALGMEEKVIKEAVESFEPVEGRLQFVGKVGSVEVYNDNNSTTPQATITGLEALDGGKKDLVLIMGGSDKGLDTQLLMEKISQTCKAVVLLAGTGTEKIKPDIHGLRNVKVREGEKLEEVVNMAFAEARNRGRILFSPAFASFSKYFENEYERNDEFVRLVKRVNDKSR